MPLSVLDFDWPDRVVIGTIGLPGSRTFYLQVRAGTRIVSVTLEKQQAALLADKLDEILDQLRTIEGNPFSVPTSTPVELVDNDPLDAVQERFRTGVMGLGWDPSTAQIVIEASPLVDDDEVSEDDLEDDDAGGADDDADVGGADVSGDDGTGDGGALQTEMLLVRMPVGAARAFAKRTHEVVGAGRPACPRCGYPIDPDGHVCTLPQD